MRSAQAMRSPLVKLLTSRLLILTGALTSIALGLRLSHSTSTLEAFAGAFLFLSGVQVALWAFGIRLELLANTSSDTPPGFQDEGGNFFIPEQPTHDKEWIEKRLRGLQKQLRYSEKRLESQLKSNLNEVEGRFKSISGHVMAESSIDPSNILKVTDKDKLIKAVSLCQDGYDMLSDVAGPSAFMALNNLVYYSCILNDVARGDFLLEKARLLLQAGQAHDSTDLILTASLAILRFADSQEDRKHAINILVAIMERSSTTDRQRREASSYLSILADSLTGSE